MKRIAIGWTALALVAAAPLLAQEDGLEDEGSKLERVVLYKHGLAYFERVGSVSGDATLTLGFKHDQMKDVLKSFYAVDLDGGRIANISYDSATPLEKQLEEILVRVPTEQSLTGLLTRLQGARLRLEVQGRTIEGQLLGLQEEKRRVDDGTILTSNSVSLLLPDGSIRSIPLQDVVGFTILDEALRADVRRYLDLTLQGKHKDRKSVRVYAVGDGTRDVLIGYLLETPVWKTSYRLLFGEDGQPVLQGWALVENPTDEDWERVRVSLVAGNPISFVMDLYQPYYPTRPVVPIEVLFPDVDVRAGVPVPPSAPGPVQDAAPSRSRMAREEAEGYAGGLEEARDAPGRAGRGLKELAGIGAAAQGAALGEMFSYAIDEPVSVPRGQSALVPILSGPVEGERLLYHNERVAANPLHAFQLKNSTGLTLDSGPVTVFESSASLGEGLLHQTLEPGMEAILTYAVQTAVDVEKSIDQDQRPIHRATLADGVLTWKLYQIHETRYRYVNRTSEEETLLVEHFRLPGYDVVEPAKPEHERPGSIRIRVELATGKPTELVVRERREVSQVVRIDRNQSQTLRFLIEQPAVSKEMKDLLAGLLATMEEIRAVDDRLRELAARRAALEQDQARYRENMARLGETARERELRSQYVDRLAASEEELGQTRTRADELNETKRKLEAALAEKIRSARFE